MSTAVYKKDNERLWSVDFPEVNQSHQVAKQTYVQILIKSYKGHGKV